MLKSVQRRFTAVVSWQDTLVQANGGKSVLACCRPAAVRYENKAAARRHDDVIRRKLFTKAAAECYLVVADVDTEGGGGGNTHSNPSYNKNGVFSFVMPRPPQSFVHNIKPQRWRFQPRGACA